MTTNKTCDNCSRPLEPGPLAAKRAPHQRFCGRLCRQAWHSRERAEGIALLKQKREQDGKGKSDE